MSDGLEPKRNFNSIGKVRIDKVYIALSLLLLLEMLQGGVVMKRNPESPLNFWFRAISRKQRDHEVGGAFSKVLMC